MVAPGLIDPSGLLPTLAQVAGLAGLALGVLFLIYREVIRKKIFPTLTKQQAYRVIVLVIVLVWTVAVTAILAPLLGVRGPAIREGDEGQTDRGVVDAETQRRERELGLERLITLVKSTQTPQGGFGWETANPASRPDPWTTAQCVAAILASGASDGFLPEIQSAFDWLAKERVGDGWRRHVGADWTLTEITAWVGIAYAAGLSDLEVFTTVREQDRALEQLGLAAATVLRRQNKDGGWPSIWATSPIRPPSVDYATHVALMFLLRARPLSAAFSLSADTLDARIHVGLRWILNEYDFRIQGWEDSEGEGLQPDLSTLHLVVLTEAKRLGFPIASDARYRRAVQEWLDRTRSELGSRSAHVRTIVRQAQEVHDEKGNFIQTVYIPAGIVWYPWSLLLAHRLAGDSDLASAQRRRALVIATRLTNQLTEMVDAMSVGQTYAAAETLFALALIGESMTASSLAVLALDPMNAS